MYATYREGVPTTPEYPNPWASLIGFLTTRPGWSPTEFHRRTGVNRRTLYRYMDGTITNVTQATIDAIAEGGDVEKRVVVEAAAGLKAQLDAEDAVDIAYIRKNAPVDMQDELIESVREMRTNQARDRRSFIDVLLKHRLPGKVADGQE